VDRLISDTKYSKFESEMGCQCLLDGFEHFEWWSKQVPHYRVEVFCQVRIYFLDFGNMVQAHPHTEIVSPP
jgi:hypothetical protein